METRDPRADQPATAPPPPDAHPASAADGPGRGTFIAIGTLLLALGALAVAWGRDGFVLPGASDATARLLATLPGFVLIAAGLAAILLPSPACWRLSASGVSLGGAVDALSQRRRAVELVLLSILGLFLEVLLIRWHSSELRAAAYFKNLTLLAAFLGLGLGFAAANKPRLSLLWSPVWLALQVIVLSFLGAAGVDEVLRMPTGQEWVWGVPLAEWDWNQPGNSQALYWTQTATFYGFYALLFISTILIFIPIGQLTGRLMRGVPPIRAYTLNILGSLGGVVLFGVVSYLWWPPVTWFALAGLLLVWALRHEPVGATLAGVCLLATLGVVASHDAPRVQQNVYSPYQRLEIEREALADASGQQLDTGVLVSANKAYHLRTINLARDFVAANGARYPRLRQMQDAYELPYAFKPSPSRALVVGAGCGNDVAAALRNGAGHVDAVEIDPAIVSLGRRFHAERPYDDSRVTVHVTDARAFMRRAQNGGAGQYDLISFGLLDSHTLLSGMSAVRLDNFVYTLESLRDARRLLKPDGVLTLSFATGAGGFLPTRLHYILLDAFGHPPRCFSLGYDDGLAFVVGDEAALAAIAPGSRPAGAAATSGPNRTVFGGDSIIRETAVELQRGVDLSTDDWPFLYLQGRQWRHFPVAYLVLVLMLAVISAVWVLAGSGRRTGISPHFFFLGAAFLLIEVKGITELALVFGTTWLVNSVVIAVILLLILLANFCVSFFPRQNPRLHYALLGATLLAGYFVPAGRLLAFGWWTAAIGATTLLLAPLFFAGIIFATSLRETASLPRAFASNLLGAILGGLCEYAAMTLGFRSLYLIGLALYALSFVTLGPRVRKGLGATAPSVA